LGPTGIDQLWISDGYTFMVAGVVITIGTLGDRVGRCRLLLLGAAAFAVLSAVAAFSAYPIMLISRRCTAGCHRTVLRTIHPACAS
jgi:MFS transporter, DHA2 family, multidrug resistance protein